MSRDPSTSTAPATPVEAEQGLSASLTLLFAIATGIIVANIYYAQALIGPLSRDLGIDGSLAGLLVTATQLGYAAGLCFLVPVSDLIENRKLAIVSIALAVLGLVGAALSRSGTTFLISSFAIGFFASGAQVLVPFASYLATPEKRGRTIGNVMFGLLGGIMLARPLANMLADQYGWRSIFWASAVAMSLLIIPLRLALPQRRPHSHAPYFGVLRSMGTLLVKYPVLRRRTLHQSIIFACFNLFWTAVPLLLGEHFGFSQHEIGLFALAGAAGALIAPVAGTWADRGKTREGTLLGLASLIVAFALAGFAGVVISVAALVLSAILLDGAVQANQIMSQRTVYSIDPHARGRLNSIFMTTMFLFGAAGSGLATVLYFHFGWAGVSIVGGVLGILLLISFLRQEKTN